MEKLTNQKDAELSAFIKENSRTPEEIKRAQAILMLTNSLSAKAILSITGLKRETVVKARKKYIKGGIAAIESKRKKKNPQVC